MLPGMMDISVLTNSLLDRMVRCEAPYVADRIHAFVIQKALTQLGEGFFVSIIWSI